LAQRVRILLLISRLRGGGAQRVISQLARSLSPEKYEIHLGLVTSSGVDATDLPPWVAVHAFCAKRVRWGAPALLRLVWRLRPPVILGGAAEVNFLALLLRPFFPPGTSVLVRQNSTVSSTLGRGDVPWFTRWLYRLLYRRADRVICQSRGMAEDLMRELELGCERLAVLPNPVDIAGIRAAISAPSRQRKAGIHLVAMGRLSREKGFDLLLRAFAKVRERFNYAELTIVGAGREEVELKALRRELGLDAAVAFAGQVERPYELFRDATVFVLSSRTEGMPNALLEAAFAGLPLVATPASEGIVDLLRDRPGAWLAPEITAEALATTIILALETIRAGEGSCREFIPPGMGADGRSKDCANEVIVK
jgi:glycosyltransferase involved in cell wall biosynthesis